MAQRLIWSPLARLDLHDLRTYIAESDPTAAARFIQAVFDAAERLTEFPESGRIVPEFGDPNLREIIKRPCRIVYRLKNDEGIVEIARVWHAARGVPGV